jgi:hypothetical protein
MSVDPVLLQGDGYAISNQNNGKKVICQGSESDVGLCNIISTSTNCAAQAIRCRKYEQLLFLFQNKMKIK